MSENTIYKDEYLVIYEKAREVYIETFKAGFSINKLNNILSSHPEIGVTSFNVLKNAINGAPKEAQKFGELKERISVEVSDDNLKATAVFNLPNEELDMKNRKKMIEETMSKLDEQGIVFGVKTEVFKGSIEAGKKYVIAEGIPPVDGRDCIIKMYELKEVKPKVRDDGKVDFYELKLINKVKTGDWLGERIEATEGIPGKSIKGEPIPPKKGKNYPLNYDRNTVQEIFYNNKTVLFSKIDGAVTYESGKITVSNHLEIGGDVGLGTGNIKFDGYLTIQGTVLDGFSVEATKDIEINGEMGLGNIKGINSTEGSIYIRGGIASKRKVEIKAKKNIYTKFVDNAIITCGNCAHIGYYSINSVINAGEVIFDSIKGQVIGGLTKADYRVLVPIVGSEIEVKTDIEVTGFNRQDLVEELENTVYKIEQLKKEQQKLKKKVVYFNEQAELTPFQRKDFTKTLENLNEINEEIKNNEEKRKTLTGLLKTRGEGEITVTKKIYPNSTLILKDRVIRITSVTLPACYFIQGEEVRKI